MSRVENFSGCDRPGNSHGDTTMTNEQINDGIYFLHPEGSCWIGAEYRDGCCVGRIEESNASTHSAAGDRYAGVVPSESDQDVDLLIAEAIVRDVMGDDIDPYCVIVQRGAV